MKLKDPYGFIYITTNVLNGKRYIGQKKFDKNWKNYLGSGSHLLKAIRKYGRENFNRSIVDIAYSLEELNEKEREWIKEYNAVESNDYYNQVDGGDVVSSLNKKNSIKVICMNNKVVFNSIKDASIWSGHTKLTIKNTFHMNNAEIVKGKRKLLFRPYDPKLNYDYLICEDCGVIYKKERQRQVRCNTCQNIRKKVLGKLRTRKHREIANT